MGPSSKQKGERGALLTSVVAALFWRPAMTALQMTPSDTTRLACVIKIVTSLTTGLNIQSSRKASV
eukprot:1183852-Amphidinium_carterae.1